MEARPRLVTVAVSFFHKLLQTVVLEVDDRSQCLFVVGILVQPVEARRGEVIKKAASTLHSQLENCTAKI